jgi:hypothetical protein
MFWLKNLLIFGLIFGSVFASVADEKKDPLKVGSLAPEWTLKDAKDKAYKLTDFENRILVILGSDKTGDEENEVWGGKLAEKYSDQIAIVGLADLRGVPFFWKGRVKSSFRNRRDTPSAKYGVPILLDWKGDVPKSYGFKPEVSNQVVIDAEGVVRYIAHGKCTDEAFEKMCEILNALLKDEAKNPCDDSKPKQRD